MIKFENTVTPSVEQWRSLILGARNAMNSWEKSDSIFDIKSIDCFELGPNDLSLMMKLRNAGTDHRKFMRMITVYVDITAPLYWWKEFDTYRAGVKRLDEPNPFDIEMNSCSTMHTIHKKEFTLDDFSCEHILDETFTAEVIPKVILEATIKCLNENRAHYLSTKDKKYWWQMIQLLPTSYNQKRTVMLNYEVLANIYKSRKDHKLDEWREFCCWIEELPYAELIMGSKKLPSAEDIAVLFEEVKKLDTRVATYEVHELRRMQLLELFDKSGVALWSFVLNKYSLVEILDQVKRGLEILGNLEINVTNNVSTNLLEFGA